SDGDGDNASEGETPLQAIRDEAAEENAAKTAYQPDHGERDGSLAQAETFVGDCEIDAPGKNRDAGKGDTSAARDHSEICGDGEQLSDGADFGGRAARGLAQVHDGDHRNEAGGGDHEKRGLPAVARTDDAAENLACGAA